ncbi:MAG: class I SAM-dependent methyltransferase [Mycobacterium sp.]
MSSTLRSGPVATAIEELYRKADDQRRNRAGGGGRPGFEAGSAQERADAMAEVYMPIAPMAGQLLYSLIRAARPEVVVEFGMSFGISTLHLAAAVRDNGVGRVYTTELSETKIASAAATFADAGVADVITVLPGDARTTLAGVPGPVAVVLLDGWKEMYLEVLTLLQPSLSPGALVIADNTESAGAQPYLAHVRAPESGYVSVNFPGKQNDTMEISCWAGR